MALHYYKVSCYPYQNNKFFLQINVCNLTSKGNEILGRIQGEG